MQKAKNRRTQRKKPLENQNQTQPAHEHSTELNPVNIGERQVLSPPLDNVSYRLINLVTREKDHTVIMTYLLGKVFFTTFIQ